MKNESIAFIMAGRRQRHRRWILVTSFLVVLACILCGAMLLLGNTIHPVKDVIRALLGEQVQGVSFAVNTIRLPRMLAGVFAGFAFGVAGDIFQTMLRNPLANPNVIGITIMIQCSGCFLYCYFACKWCCRFNCFRDCRSCYSNIHLYFIQRKVLFHRTINPDWNRRPGNA